MKPIYVFIGYEYPDVNSGTDGKVPMPHLLGVADSEELSPFIAAKFFSTRDGVAQIENRRVNYTSLITVYQSDPPMFVVSHLCNPLEWFNPVTNKDPQRYFGVEWDDMKGCYSIHGLLTGALAAEDWVSRRLEAPLSAHVEQKVQARLPDGRLTGWVFGHQVSEMVRPWHKYAAALPWDGEIMHERRTVSRSQRPY